MSDQTPAAGHNIQSLSGILATAFAARYRIEQEIKEATEDLKTEQKEVWDQLKTDTGMEAKDLNLHYRLFARDQECKTFEEDDRVRVQDTQRALFEATAIGKTVSFMDVLERVESGSDKPQRAPRKPKGKSEDRRKVAPSDAFSDGYERGKAAKGSRDDNPFDEESDSHTNWNDGWDQAQRENAAKLQAPAAAE